MNNYIERLKEVKSLDELKCQFELCELVEMARTYVLSDWLSFDMSGETNLNQILTANVNDDDELRLLLCEALQWDIIHDLSTTDALAIERALEKRRLREIYMEDAVQSDDAALVKNQAELMQALLDEATVVYLLPNEYRIPLTERYYNVTYIGKNAVICIDSCKDVDLDEAGIVFKGDIKIYLEHDISLKMNASPNIEVRKFYKSSLNGTIQYRDICRALQGRDSFELQQAFEERIKALTGIVVGDVLFREADYDREKQIYKVYLHWRIDYLTQVRYLAEKQVFYLEADLEFASRLFFVECKMLLYADFETSGDKVVISQLYFITQAGDYIYLKSRQSADYETSLVNSGGGGYGMYLVFKDQKQRLEFRN